MILRIFLYVVVVVFFLCYVKGGDYGGYNMYIGYGLRYGGWLVCFIFVIYLFLY